MRMFLCLKMLAVALLWQAGVATAAPLADRVPGDALVYVGWQGADEAAAGFEQTHLKQLLDQTRLRELIGQTLPLLVEKHGPNTPQIAMAQQLLQSLGPILWHRPWGIYLGGMIEGMEPGAPPMPRIGLVISPGEYEEAFNAQLAQFQMMGAPLAVVKQDGVVRVTLLEPEQADVGGGLAASEAFSRAMRPLAENAVAVAYVDAAGILAMVRAQAASHGTQEDAQELEKIIETLGLEGVKHVGATAGFDAARWRTQVFVHAPAPREGVVRWLFEGETIDDRHLARAPRNATWMTAFQLDLAEWYQQIRTINEAHDPASQDDLDGLLFMASAMTGVDIEADLLRGLGSVWVVYRNADIAGPANFLGTAVANELREPERVAEALRSLAVAVGEATKPKWDDHPHFRFVSFEHEGVAIHSFVIPFVQPAWAVHDGVLHAGLLPQAVMSAIDFAESDGQSILENERFQVVRGWLGDRDASAVSFADVERTAPVTYGAVMMVGQLASSMAIALSPEDDGRALPVLPTLGRLSAHLEPTGQVAWADDDGWHISSISPFPGSELLVHQGFMGPNMAALSVGVMLPALGAARQTARQMQSNTQARGIHQAMVMYAHGNNGKMPNDLVVLLEGNFFTPDYAISPTAPGHLASEAKRYWHLPEDEQRRWLRQNASYVLIPDLVDDLDTNTVALFERPNHAAGDMIAVAFNDNRVERMHVHRVRQLVQEQTGKTLEELLERQQTYTDE